MTESAASMAFTNAVVAVSFIALLYLIQRLLRGETLLHQVPRSRVPWTFGVALVLQLPTLLALLTSLLFPSDESNAPEPADFVEVVWGNFAVMLVVALGTYVVLKFVFLADRIDLGLPGSWGELARDIGLGTFAFLACLFPVLGVSVLLQSLAPPETMHPFIETILEGGGSSAFVAVAAAAVIQAPLFEETAFRLVLQGWLEKWEDRLTGNTATRREPTIVALESSTQAEIDEIDKTSAELHHVANDETPSTPRRRLISWLPHGWLPIVISATFFGLAHFGHGWDPVPLVLLGLILGYLYQRTHQIVPCIVLHALFNAFSIIKLWLIIP